jgi:hypothetical protein
VVGVDVVVAVGVAVGLGGGVAVGVGVAPVPDPTTKWVLLVVARVRTSILPEVATCERSAVDVVMQYCTDVPAGWAGITAE